MAVNIISNLHFVNMALVLASGTVTAIWGFILYFFVLKKWQPSAAPTAAKSTVGTRSPGKQIEKAGKVERAERAERAERPAALKPWNVALTVTAILSLLQALLGITLVLLGQRPGTGTGLYYLHYVYGAIVALSIPVAITYTTSGKHIRRDVLILSLAALILVAAGVRALMTGPH